MLQFWLICLQRAHLQFYIIQGRNVQCSRWLVCVGDWITELVTGHEVADERGFFVCLGHVGFWFYQSTFRAWFSFAYCFCSSCSYLSAVPLQNWDAVQNFSSMQQPRSQGLILHKVTVLNKIFIAQFHCMEKQSSVVVSRPGCGKWFNVYMYQDVIKQYTLD